MKGLLLILLTFLLPAFAGAQTFEQTWAQSIRPFYSETYDIQTEISVFSNFMMLKKLESREIRYQRQDGKLLISSGSYDQLITPEFTVIADHIEQALMIGPTTNNKAGIPIISLDSMLQLGAEAYSELILRSITEIKDKDGSVVFIFRHPNEEYSSVEFWFNARKDQLLKLRLFPTDFYNRGTDSKDLPVVEYTFKYNKELIPPSLFSGSNYFVKKNKTVSPAKKFSHYTVLNQL